MTSLGRSGPCRAADAGALPRGRDHEAHGLAGVGRDGQPTETKGEGTIKGNDVTWKIVRETQRGTFESIYKGTLVDDNNMKGTMERGGMATPPAGGNPPAGGQMTPTEWTAVRKAK